MKILVIAEAPGEQEDKKNIQLIGPAGQYLRKILHDLSIDLDRDCRKTNAVRCRPPENRKPTSKEIEVCNSHIWDEIKQNAPKAILLLGQTALESFLINRWHKDRGQIGTWRGFVIPDQKARCWICSTYHPSYLLREQENVIVKNTFKWDIQKLLSYLDEPFQVSPEPDMSFVPCRAPVKFLQFISRKVERIAFDYETTGIRPFREGHRVVTCAMAWKDGLIAFLMDDRRTVEQWKRILANPLIKKIAHNIKFEHLWGLECLGVETVGWEWDTMLASHLIDNRRGITSLKFQTYLNFGVDDYSRGMENELSSIEKNSGANGFNPLKETEPSQELLLYNARDAFYTFYLAQKQKELFK